ncbi:MAG: allophanate hydrolase [Microthrixaceae bacterium]
MSGPVPPTRSATAAATDAATASLAAIDADGRDGIWIELLAPEVVLAAAAAVDRRVAAGEDLPLAGTTLAVKGNIDVDGVDTTAACPAFAHRPERSAAAVQALVDAGTVVVGVTNLDQFATGLVGTRSPYGICPNAHWPGLVSGGSSSGSAVAVAAGMVDLALGTDTAGSGRVPAAANGIVGIKPTRGRISTAGVVPACASLDCVSVFARDVGLAQRAVAVASATAPDAQDPWSRRAVPVPPPDGPLRVGVPPPDALDTDGDRPAAERHAAAVRTFLAAAAHTGVEVVEIGHDDLDRLVAAGRLLYEGAFVAERYAAVGAFVDAHRAEVDPVVGGIISAAADLPAWRLAGDLTTLAGYRAAADRLFERIDVLVVPSVPRVPTVAEVLADPIGVNAMLGTYTNFVNLLDLCALTLPVGEAPEAALPPPSLTLIAPAWTDDRLVDLALSVPTDPRSGPPGGPATRPSP